MANSSKRNALGRGLSALLPTQESAEASPQNGEAKRDYFQAAIETIYPDPKQPRRNFTEADLEELSASIRVHGIIQPLIVRKRSQGGYTLIAGERRWRAAQRAGVVNVPVVVQDVDEKEAFERALVENVQRADLNPIEEAQAYNRLLSDFGYTQKEVADRVGKQRSTVANAIRLLRLPEKVTQMVEEGVLSMGHARALLSLDENGAIEGAAKTVVAKSLSVRGTEKLVASLRTAAQTKPKATKKKTASAVDLEKKLQKALGLKAEVIEHFDSAQSGKLVLHYPNLDELDGLLAKLLGN